LLERCSESLFYNGCDRAGFGDRWSRVHRLKFCVGVVCEVRQQPAAGERLRERGIIFGAADEKGIVVRQDEVLRLGIALVLKNFGAGYA